MNFQDSVTTCMKKYFDFNGRASRSEYWWFVLFCIIVQIVAGMINHNLLNLLSLALILPSLAVLARRVHDIDKSAWWLLILLVPLIGSIVILIFTLMKGTEGPNRYDLPSA